MSRGTDSAVSIVVLNGNTGEETIECLASFSRVAYDAFETTVVDNDSHDSHDDSVEAIPKYAAGEIEVDSNFSSDTPGNEPLPLAEYTGPAAQERERVEDPFDGLLTLLKTDANDGCPGGCNIDIRYAMAPDADDVLLLNNNTVVDGCIISALVATAETDASVGVVGPLVYDYEAPDWLQTAGSEMRWWLGLWRNYDGDDERYDGIVDRDFLWGMCQPVRTDALDEIELLDTRYFFGNEEYEFCVRVKRPGYRVGLQAATRTWHRRDKSLDRMDDPEATDCIERRRGIMEYRDFHRLLRRQFPPVAFLVAFVVRHVCLAVDYLRYYLRRAVRGA